MEIVLILVPVTLLLVGLGVVLFSWAVKNGQYDDLDGPAHRILYDDDKDMIPEDARQDKNAGPGKTEEDKDSTLPESRDSDRKTSH